MLEQSGLRLGLRPHMTSRDWFRNTDWNTEIEAQFGNKLRRALDKAQPLRIQASYLAQSRPDVALTLLKQYFALGDHFDSAQAFVVEATAYRSLNHIDEAINSLRKALERERQRPNVKTQAWRDFALLIAEREIRSRFDEALTVLDEQAASSFVFPIDRFHCHAAYALIRSAQGKAETAREHAAQALRAAETQHSGFRYHPKVGVVNDEYEELRYKLLLLTSAPY